MTDTGEEPPAPLRIREAARALVIDDDHRVLLVRWQFPDGAVWGTPGGGVEPDEDVVTALRRELDEELGIGDTVAIGPQIWDRTHIIPFVNGLWDGQHDRTFLVRTPAFEPAPRLSRDELVAEHLHEIRWWELDELVSYEPPDGVWFAPRRLPRLVAELVADGPPAAPLETGV